MTEVQASSTPVLYSKPEPLDRERHAALGLKRQSSPFAFAANVHAVPLNGAEFNLAQKSYPIIFTGGAKPQALAVLGVETGRNLFVDEAGQWAPGTYIPGYIRRYPFIFATTNLENQYALCVDTDSPLVSETPDVPFFEQEDLSETAKSALDFCQRYQELHQLTRRMMDTILGLDLVDEQDMSVNLPDGSPHKLGVYRAVNEQKLNALSGEQFLTLRGNNVLALIYLHLASLSNWQRLVEMHVRRTQPDTPSA